MALMNSKLTGNVRKGDTWRNRGFKNYCMYWGFEETMCMPTEGLTLRNKSGRMLRFHMSVMFSNHKSRK
jgi:hypothetical protein